MVRPVKWCPPEVRAERGLLVAAGPGGRWAAAMLDLNTGAILWCVLTGLLFAGLWLGYERRDRARWAALRRRATFHCTGCGHLHAAPLTEQETAACPRCGKENARLRF
jgi:hypothetical protein